MKKIFSIVFSIVLVAALNAQEVAVDETATDQASTASTDNSTLELKSKKGINILPEAGEFGLSVDATPFLTYLGGVFSSEDATIPYFSSSSDDQYIGITGKYFLDSKTAIRASFLATFTSSKTIYDDVLANTTVNDPTNPLYVDDIVKTSESVIGISAGIEKRRGNSRVQGFYGGEVAIQISSYKTVYDYGNSMSEEYRTPETYSNEYGSLGERIIESAVNNQLNLGARGFVGVEFFIGPKISLGSEFGLSLFYEGNNTSQDVYEYYNDTENDVLNVAKENSTDDTKSFGIVTNLDGNISLNFYF